MCEELLDHHQEWVYCNGFSPSYKRSSMLYRKVSCRHNGDNSLQYALASTRIWSMLHLSLSAETG